MRISKKSSEMNKTEHAGKTIFGILLIVMLGIGCVDNSTQTQEQTQEQTQVQTSAATTVVDPYGDQGWLDYQLNYGRILRTDLDNITNSMNTSDFISMQQYGTNLQNHTQEAITENQKYKTTKYSKAQTEWDSAMRDLNTAGYYFTLMAENRGSDLLSLSNLNDYITKGVDHLGNYTQLRDAANNTTV
ncbi:MAG: hypothetical protein QG646_1456 [Euryarchaeota archaeon]|nr:hypothetical protein [Euryarchaeota archaeon]